MKSARYWEMKMSTNRLCRKAPVSTIKAMICAGVSAAALLGGSASAQVTSTSDEKENAENRAIVVTGSRIARTGFSEPSPITIIDAQQFKDLGQVSVGEILQTIPQNSNFVSSTNVGQGNFNVGAQLANLRGLNPYYGTRTLTLVDGRRFVPSTNGGAVDTALIPAIMLERSEVVTGGASAIYGTDAVAGVVNLILAKKMTGIKAQVDYGISRRGDGEDFHAAAAGGFSFGDGRGNLVVGGEYQKSWEVGACSQVRDWCKDFTAVITNPNFRGANANGMPNRIIADDVTYTWTSYAGVFPTLSRQFNSDGTSLSPFDPGQYANMTTRTAGASAIGGDGDVRPYQTLVIRPPVKRYSAYGRLGYELTPTLEAGLELSYGRRSSVNTQGSSGAQRETINPDNFFLQEAGIVLASATPFSKSTNRIIQQFNDTNNETWRMAFSLDGELSSDWNWSAYYTRGVNHQTQRVLNNRVTTFFRYALDAVDNPNQAGRQPICRALLSADPAVRAAAQGCVPLNLFGLNNADPAALAYAFRTLPEDFRYTQDVIAGSISGNLFEGVGAGPFGMAVGAEYRHEYGIVTHGDLDYYPYFSTSYGDDYGGQLDVYEAYGELDMPLLRNVPGAETLELSLAGRNTWNKTKDTIAGSSASVDFTTWRANVVYAPTDWLRLRVTRSRDVRAAGFRELYRGAINRSDGGGTVNNPGRGGDPDPANINSGGNVGLQPEMANTLTAGLVISPRGFLSGLRLSVDWYEINLSEAVGQVGTSNIVQFCYDYGNFCDRIAGIGQSASPRGGIQFADITDVDNSQTNLAQYITRGIDAEVSYTVPLGGSSRLNFRVFGSYLYDMIVDTGAGGGQLPINYAGQSGPVAAFGSFNTSPKLQGSVFVTYSDERFTAAFNGRFVGKGTYNVTYLGPEDEGYAPTLPNSIDDNRLPARLYSGLTLTYRFPLAGKSDGLEIFGSVNNLFDVKPVRAPGGNGYPTNPVYFDTVGQTFRLGARVKF
jgi:iron complex outermembrane receptor protein